MASWGTESHDLGRVPQTNEAGGAPHEKDSKRRDPSARWAYDTHLGKSLGRLVRSNAKAA